MSIGKPKIEDLKPILLKISQKYNIDLTKESTLKGLSSLMFKCEGEYYIFLSYLNSYFNSGFNDVKFLTEHNFNELEKINEKWILDGCPITKMNLLKDFKSILSKKIKISYK